MKLKSAITGALAAVLVFSSALPSTAFADCTFAYQSAISEIAIKEYFNGVGIGHNEEAKPKWGLSSAIFLVAPLGVTGLLTTLDSIRIADRKKTLDLIAAARIGDGLPIARLADSFGTTVERAAEVILELNSKRAFCIREVLSYGEVYELIGLKLNAQK